MGVNDAGDVVGFWFSMQGPPHNWAIWLAAPPNHAPAAIISPVSSANEGAPITFNGALSSDIDGDPLTYAWTFGDGATGAGPSPMHTYADNGSYTVTLTVSDGKLNQSISTAVSVINVAPVTTASSPGFVTANASFSLAATNFNDPSSADLSAGLRFAFDCGDGYGQFTTATSATCTAPPFGSRALHVMVRDKDGGSSSADASIDAIDDMNIQPGSISLTTTGTVSVYLYSTAGFDATQTSAASVRLVVQGSDAPGASVATRGGAPMTAIGDYNYDGRPDRLFVFLRTALQTAGLSADHPTMQLEDRTGSLQFTALDATPPAITP
jgi:PKD repeat protein